MMKTLRWLLPFMHGVDMRAIDSVVNLAASTGATLVAVSLISVPDKSRSGGARLEHIQQSKDFLEAVKWKAARYSVLIERYEVFTGNVLQSLTLLVHDQECDSIVLVTAEKRDMLLPALEVKHLLEEPPASLVLLRLPARAERTWHPGTRFLTWLRRHGRQQDNIGQGTPDIVEEPSWIRTEEHHLG
jgi:hypothetical protein